MYSICISPKPDTSISCSKERVFVSKKGTNKNKMAIKIGGAEEVARVKEILTKDTQISIYKDLRSNLGLLARSNYIKIVNYMFASSMLDVKLIGEGGSCYCKIEENSYAAKILTLRPEKLNLSIDLMSMNCRNDKWQLENSLSKIIVKWKKREATITRYITEVMEGLDKWEDEWKNEVYNLLVLNMESEINNELVNSMWARHDISFNKMTRDHDDLTDRTGSYRFGTKNEWLSRLDRNNALEPLQYHIQRGLPPYSQRITKSKCAEIDTKELLELFNRAFANLKAKNANDCGNSEKYNFDILHRPYPSAGGIYEQKFYLLKTESKNSEKSARVMNYNCSYRNFVSQEGNEKLQQLIASYLKRCWVSSEAPAYILLITGIYPALSYKYNNIAYRLMLLNAGCALSSFYEACRSLNIGCCPGGTGPTKAITKLLGVDEHIETPVLEVGFGKHTPG
ncbi:nitroreductase family protein [Prochlorococcus marinus]|uniref:nitroreductase family protein n=1 Tax=Prochlorococcus marinus TaxID=1219 RepID=UPI0007B3E8A0|nr:nitroreductase family protein [Prochlorococcus marinus]KZR74881.1 Nitroreductase family protein [Prochlorococcus marinus str. MIT 1320]